MYKKIKFIGRKKELDTIQTFINTPNQNHIVFLEADGGIGKTRILKEIEDKYKSDNEIILSRIIDYDEYSYLNLDIVINAIINTIGKDKYFSEYYEYRVKYPSDQKLLNNIFAQLFNEISNNKKFILLIDTAEKTKSSTFWNGFREFVKNLQNVLIVIAGRGKDHKAKPFNRRKEFFDNKISTYYLTSLELNSFSKEEAVTYFNTKIAIEKIQAMSDNLIDCAVYLSKGKPIILDLAIEWLARAYQDNPNDFFLKKLNTVDCTILNVAKPDDLEKKREQLVTSFENNDDNIKNLIYILLYIPKINFDMAREIYSTITLDDFNELKELIFIKDLDDDYITLHDEMNRLLQNYIVPRIDDEGLRKKLYSEKIVSFYEKKIDKLKNDINNNTTNQQFKMEKELEFNTIEFIRHLFIASQSEEDTENAMIILMTTMIEARNNSNYEFIQALMATLDKENITHKMSLGQETDFITMKAKSLSSEGKNQKAKDLLINFEKDNVEKLTEYQKANLRNMLAGIQVSMGRLRDAIDNQLFAYGIFEKANKNREEIYSGIHLGITYNDMGNYKKAIDYFESSMKATKSLVNEKEKLQAIIFNHLANVYRNIGGWEIALTYAQQAKKISEKINAATRLAIVYMTLGNIERDRNNYEDAQRYYNEAISRLDEHKDIASYLDLLINEIHLNLFIGLKLIEDETSKTSGKKQLKDALKDTLKAEDIARNNSYNTELVKALSLKSNLYWIDGKRKEAKEALNEFYGLSEKYGQIFYRLDAILGYVEFAYDEKIEGLKDAIFRRAKELENYKEEYYFPQLYGRMKLYQAKVLFDEKAYDEAMKYYRDGFIELSKHGGYSIFSIENELEVFLKRLKTLEEEKALVMLENLAKEWRNNSKLHQWCQTNILFLVSGI